MRCDGDRVRITAPLIEAGNETHLWYLYDRDLSEGCGLTSGRLSLAVQIDVALRVAGALAFELVPNAVAPAESPPTALSRMRS